jgi:Lhr-like helicase
MRQMPGGSGRKLVLFSDSRQDAAKLSTGIKRDHYLDTVRQIAFRELQTEAGRTDAAYRQALTEYQRSLELLDLERKRDRGPLTQEERRRRHELLSTLPSAAAGAIARFAAGGGAAPSVLTRPQQPGRFAVVAFRSLLDVVRGRLLDIGINPGGVLPSVMEYQPSSGPVVRWESLIDWDAQPRGYRRNIQPVERTLMDNIEASLRKALIQDVLFADGSRDFESLGLGFLWVNVEGPETLADYSAASVIRMLGKARRWRGSEAQGQPNAPPYIDDFIKAVAARAQTDRHALTQNVRAILGSTLDEWIADPEMMFLVAPLPNAGGEVDEYPCARCGRAHLQPSGEICTSCTNPLPPSTPRSIVGDPADFYEYLARCPEPPFRLNCEELTGQSDRDDRLVRQRRFQEVFMQDEVADSSGIDLLSVTTTMEAGVDIGALQAIGLANMPPVRFNYQQRVGRAGRRGMGMSATLTFCRGRRHDEY